MGREGPGSETIELMLDKSAISSANWAEVVQNSIAGGVDVDDLSGDCGSPAAQHLVSGRVSPSLIDEAN